MFVRLHNIHKPIATRITATVPSTIPGIEPPDKPLDWFLGELSEFVEGVDELEGDDVGVLPDLDELPVLAGLDVDVGLFELPTCDPVELGVMFSGARAAATPKLVRRFGEALMAPNIPPWQCFPCEQ